MLRKGPGQDPIITGLLPDWAIRQYIGIEPYAEGIRRPGTVSYGVTSYGYDARIGRDYKVLSNHYGEVCIDPTMVDERAFITMHAGEGKDIIIPPNGYILAETIEEFYIPRDVQATCVGKSTYARCGGIVNVTPLEPEWWGKVTLEISNSSGLPLKIKPEQGICQFIFTRAQAACQVSYADKKGIYQGQTNITLPRVAGEQ